MSTSDMQAVPNGNYSSQQAPAYDYTQNASAQTTAGSATSSNPDISKEEVGWFFVEKYYTTLSKYPDRLYLFYNKRSQFLMGTEADKVMTAVGQKAIDQKIKEQEIKDCKVRVSNVDTQGSGQNIVIQVIGEISINSAPQKKFTQTFVLAEQTNGYFVLNDIFRFLADEDEDAPAESEDAPKAATNEAVSGHQESSTSAEAEPNTVTSQDSAVQAPDAETIDKSIQEAIADDKGDVEPPAAAINGADISVTSEADQADQAPSAATPSVDETVPSSEVITETIGEQDVVAPEDPKEPEPTRAASPEQAVAPTSTKPSAPKTWANLVAGNRVALPASATSVSPAAAAQTKAAATAATPPAAAPATPASTAPATAQQQAPASAPVAPAQDIDRADTPKSADSEWQTAQRHDHSKKHQRPQQPVNPEQNRGYIKNVGEDVVYEELKDAMAKFGELHYFDINRGKRCAFVDWKSPASYQAATAANPHRLSNVTLIVEERHVKPPGVVPNSGGYRGGYRGGARGGFNDRGGRGGGNRGNRGGAGGQRRGGAGAQPA